MGRPSRVLLAVVVVCTAFVAGRPCMANGMFVSREAEVLTRGGSSGASSAQTGLVIRQGGHEVLVLRTTYRGPAEDFAWIVPVLHPPDERDGLFTVPSGVIDGALLHSAPHRRFPAAERWTMGAETEGRAADASSGAVRVLQRREVGEYDASVLAAEDASALARWLGANGYRLPPEASPVVADYIRRHWVFVAMRVLDWVQAKKPVLDAVTPIAIRFRTESLVFPLLISKVSAPARTSLLLLVYDSGPVRCRELPVRYTPPMSSLGPGDSYERRRARLATEGGPGLACEYLGRTGDLAFMDSLRAPSALRQEGGRPRAVWLSRLWTLLDRDAMVDLTFEPDRVPREPYRLEVNLGAPGQDQARPGRLRSTSGRQEASWVSSLADAQERIEGALEAFRADTGCYPASLADLAATSPPAFGQDASGNRVRLAARPLKPYLSALPRDPLTGRTQSWILTVAGEAIVQSGGLSTTVARRPPYVESTPTALGWNSPAFPVARAAEPVAHEWTTSLPEDAAPGVEVRSFFANKATERGRLAAIEGLDGRQWGVVAAGTDEAAVLLGSTVARRPDPLRQLQSGDEQYVRATRDPFRRGWAIRAATGGGHELVQLPDPQWPELSPTLALAPVSPETLVAIETVGAVVSRLGDEPAVVVVPEVPWHHLATLLPLPQGHRVAVCHPATGVSGTLVVCLEPERTTGLGEVWLIGNIEAAVAGGGECSRRLAAQYYCEPGRTRVAVMAEGYQVEAVAWALPDSPRAGVRVTRLTDEGPHWLPVTTLAPEGGWDYRHYRRARKWIGAFASASDVPVLPL